MRMDDSRLSKQLFFAELDVEKHRPVGRPRTTWNDCVLDDLVYFGFGEKDYLLTDLGWHEVKALTLDRDVWRKRLKSDGLEYALDNWYKIQTARRANKMSSRGVQRQHCTEVSDQVVVRVDDAEDCEEPSLPDYARLRRTPLECVPNSTVLKMLRFLGSRLTQEMLSEVKRVEEKRPRPMNEYSAWAPPFISSRVEQHAEAKVLHLRYVERCKAIRSRRIEREAMYQEWLPTSNHFDYNWNANEKFALEKFNGFRRRGVDGAKTDQYHVVYVPRFFAADIDFPEELPEVIGLPWAEYDEDWVEARPYERSYRNDKRITEQLGLLRRGVVGCVVVGGVE
jgi:hypothetical protein